MAIPVAAGVATFDQSDGEFLDLSDVLAAVLLADVWLLGALPFGGMAKQTTHYFMEDELNPISVTQAAGNAMTDSGADVDLILDSAANAARLAVGTLLRNKAAGKKEVIQLISLSSATWTVTRAYGSTVRQAHTAAAEWQIVAMPKQENDKTVSDISRTRTRVYNRTEIFKKEVEISRSMRVTDSAGVPDELRYQIANRTMELKRELGTCVWDGIRSTDAGSDTAIRTMGGIREYLTTAGGNERSTSEVLGETVVNALYRSSWDDGGDPSLCVGPADQITAFSSINQDKIRLAPSDRLRGVFVTKYLTNLGKELSLLVDRWIHLDELGLLDPSRIKVMPLIGSNWMMEPLAKVGDGDRAQLVGEFTLEVRNAAKAHAIHTNLQV